LASILCQARCDNTSTMRHDGSYAPFFGYTIRSVPSVVCWCDSATAGHSPLRTIDSYRVCVALHRLRKLVVRIKDEVGESRIDMRCQWYCDTVLVIALAGSSRGVIYAILAHKVKPLERYVGTAVSQRTAHAVRDTRCVVIGNTVIVA
jgi:hypothetical protein